MASRSSLDIFAPPILFGLNYAFMFGFAVIDVVVNRTTHSYRLRDEFYHFHSVSPAAVALAWAGFLAFVLAYFAPFGDYLSWLIRQLLVSFSGVRQRTFARNTRVYVLITVLFGVAYRLTVSAIREFGAGRVPGEREFDASVSYQFIAGEISFIAYVFAAWYVVTAKRRRQQTSRLFVAVVFAMLVLQIALSVWLGSRTRLVVVVLASLLIWHYGYRHLKVRHAAAVALLCILIVLPAMVLHREAADAYATGPRATSGGRFVWDSFMRHYSALEGYTVTFEYLPTAPKPDPLWMIFGSGLIPRVVWPSKPVSTWAARFSLWVTGVPSDAFFPSLPGELLLHFGYFGSVVAMAGLGVLWKTLYRFFRVASSQPHAVGCIYIVLFSQALSQLEVGFVIPYGALLRESIIALLLFAAMTKSVRARAPKAARMRTTIAVEAVDSSTA